MTILCHHLLTVHLHRKKNRSILLPILGLPYVRNISDISGIQVASPEFAQVSGIKLKCLEFLLLSNRMSSLQKIAILQCKGHHKWPVFHCRDLHKMAAR